MLGQVDDPQTAKESLDVSLIPGGTATGIIVGGIGVAPNGVAFATVFSANCTATSGTVRFEVSDGQLTDSGDVQVNVSPNPLPELGNYTDASLKVGEFTQFVPASPPTDNGSISSFSAVIQPDSFTGSLSLEPSTGLINIGNAGPEGVYTITATVIDNCDAKTMREVNLQVVGDTIFNSGFEVQ